MARTGPSSASGSGAERLPPTLGLGDELLHTRATRRAAVRHQEAAIREAACVRGLDGGPGVRCLGLGESKALPLSGSFYRDRGSAVEFATAVRTKPGGVVIARRCAAVVVSTGPMYAAEGDRLVGVRTLVVPDERLAVPVVSAEFVITEDWTPWDGRPLPIERPSPPTSPADAARPPRWGERRLRIQI